MDNKLENLKGLGRGVDAFLGGVTSLAASGAALFVFATIPILGVWGLLWLLNKMGIV